MQSIDGQLDCARWARSQGELCSTISAKRCLSPSKTMSHKLFESLMTKSKQHRWDVTSALERIYSRSRSADVWKCRRKSSFWLEKCSVEERSELCRPLKMVRRTWKNDASIVFFSIFGLFEVPVQKIFFSLNREQRTIFLSSTKFFEFTNKKFCKNRKKQCGWRKFFKISSKNEF